MVSAKESRRRRSRVRGNSFIQTVRVMTSLFGIPQMTLTGVGFSAQVGSSTSYTIDATVKGDEMEGRCALAVMGIGIGADIVLERL